MQNLATVVSLPWFLLGDFNDMLSNDEKMGGLPVNRYRITVFRNYMDRCGLMDFGFHGPRFTWTTKSPIWQNNIMERLDRGLGNAGWKLRSSLLLKFTTSLGLNSTTVPLCLSLTP